MTEPSETAPPLIVEAPKIPLASVPRVGRVFLVLYPLASISTTLLFIAPLLVTLALRINSLVGIERAPGNLAQVAGAGALLAIFANPVFGMLSDRTSWRLGRRRTWMLAGLVGGAAGVLISSRRSWPITSSLS